MINYSLHKIGISTALVVMILVISPAYANDDVKKGREVYGGTCIACHGENGKGEIPGVPDFTSSKGPLSKEDAILMDHMINGFQGPASDMEMPALGGNEDLTEQDIKNVLAYLRATFKHRK